MKKDRKAEQAFEAFDKARPLVVSGITITLEPLGVKHLRKFSAAITKAAPDLVAAIDISSLVSEEDGKDPEISDAGIGSFVKALVPFFLTDLVDLVDDCCSVSLEKVPLNLVPEIIKEWFDLSFGDKEEGFKRLRPWMDLALEIMSRVPKAKKQEQTSTTQSTNSSQPDTAGPTLSTTGQFPNSGGTSGQL